MARPKLPDTMETISVRLPKSMVEEIDQYVESLKDELPLLSISRADGMRQLIALGLSGVSRKPKKARG
jgi:hypothetical protein